MIDSVKVPTGNGMTITILRLCAQNEGAEVRVCILLESGEHREEVRLIIGTEQYCEIKPQRGVISEELYDRLEAAAQLHSAIRRGEGLLAFGANSARMLTQKLMQRGFDREVAECAAEKLREMGLIDEENDLCREVEKCLRKLWGASRIRAHLWSRGFGNDAMAQLPDILEKIDFTERCAQLIRKRYGAVHEEPDERRRMVASLARYGYTLTEIKAAIRLLQ